MNEHENCQALLGQISDYVDGELNQDLCTELERHLGHCENCRIVLDTLKKTIELYQVNAETESMPKGVKERLFYKLDLQDYLK